MGRVTLNDVAERAGVSRATASLVVRGSARISPATSERVRMAMAELGYLYDRRAAVLRGGASMTIGAIVPEIRNPYLSEMIMAIESVLHEAGYTVLVGHSHDEGVREAEILATMVERHVDGLLLHPAQGSDQTVVDRYTTGSDTPVVLTMRHFDGDHSYVGPDAFAAGEMLGRHLRSIGARSVQLVGGPLRSSARRDRIAGLASGLTADVALDPGESTATSTNYADAGERAMSQVFDGGPLADVLVGFSDVVTMGMYAEIYRRGLAPGRDVAVASFDDVLMAPWLTPPLTSVDMWPGRVGTAAAELLLEQIGGRRTRPAGTRPAGTGTGTGTATVVTEVDPPPSARTVLLDPVLRPRASTLTWRPRGRVH